MTLVDIKIIMIKQFNNNKKNMYYTVQSNPPQQKNGFKQAIAPKVNTDQNRIWVPLKQKLYFDTQITNGTITDDRLSIGPDHVEI